MNVLKSRPDMTLWYYLRKTNKLIIVRFAEVHSYIYFSSKYGLN